MKANRRGNPSRRGRSGHGGDVQVGALLRGPRCRGHGRRWRRLRAASQKRFDVVFLDVQLPGIDGLATLARLRANRSTRDLPVAMLTNSGDETLRRRARSLRILDWLVKSETTPASSPGG